MITILSSDLTTPVPPPLAQRFNLRPGAQLDWEAGEDGFVIHVKVAAPTRLDLINRLHELGAKHRRPDADAVADLVRERIEDDDLRDHAL